MLALRNASLIRPTAWSLSALTASFTRTCRIRCVPPFRSRPRWMRFWMPSARALPLRLFGTPKMPNRNASMMTTMKMTFQSRFFFIDFLLRLGDFFARSHGYHGGPRDLEAEVIGRHAQVQELVPQGDDRAPQTAAGDDVIARFQIAQHG